MESGQLAQRATVHVQSVCGRTGNRLPQAHLVLLGRTDNLLHRGVADSPRRIVDDAAKSLLVVGVHGQPEIGYHVLYLLALVEAQPAIDAVVAAHAHLGLTHFFLEGAALRIRAVENGKVAPPAPLLILDAPNLPAHHGRLALVGYGFQNGHLLTLLLAAVHLLGNLPRVVFHQ